MIKKVEFRGTDGKKKAFLKLEWSHGYMYEEDIETTK